ncbi:MULTISPECIES: hypothetical protein [unclassified Pseudomonas]|uniref:hypothetical protein n=2 Tax=Pseudomonas TaxID=286 RepID=UPI0024482784|nr:MULTISPECIES: hypothetical protein [unclassified Pseudomonas]MDH0485576.1 hypothetical protein [Pseudomonas sp. GD04015]MDH0605617.1 hypothetical protein [Pseudomonas sp. GD03869]
MSQHDSELQQERQLLEHFRQHAQGEPSAAMDARIIAAAREALAQSKPSAAQRLHAWLFGAGSRTRWSMAVAGLAVFGIGLNLALNTRDRLPQAYNAPAPAAASAPTPVLREVAPTMEAQRHSRAREYVQAEPAPAERALAESDTALPISPPAAAPRPIAPAPMADAAKPGTEARLEAKTKAQAIAKAQVEAAQAEARSNAGAGAQALAEEPPPLEQRLRQVLRLREEGQREQADRLLAELRQEYPRQDLDAELGRLLKDER